MKTDRCNYELIKYYLDDETRDEAIKHTSDCLECLDHLIKLETWLSHSKRHSLDKLNTSGLDEQNIIELAEVIVDSGRKPEAVIDYESSDWQKVLQSNNALQLLLNYVDILSAPPEEKVETPEYLRHIVRERLKIEKVQHSDESIFIRMKNGLRLLGASAQNLLPLNENTLEPAFRSAVLDRNTDSNKMLQFISNDDQGSLLYQVVQDGESTVMLTVKLQNYKELPRFMNIKREGRLIQSFPVSEDFAFFPQVSPGAYEVELKGHSGQTIKQVAIEIVTD